jgi:hypothetical protein
VAALVAMTAEAGDSSQRKRALVQRVQQTAPIGPTTASGLLPALLGFHPAMAA